MSKPLPLSYAQLQNMSGGTMATAGGMNMAAPVPNATMGMAPVSKHASLFGDKIDKWHFNMSAGTTV